MNILRSATSKLGLIDGINNKIGLNNTDDDFLDVENKIHHTSHCTSRPSIIEKKYSTAELQIKNKIGHGAFGNVYNCSYNGLPNSHCVKVVVNNSKFQNREIEVLQYLTKYKHKNLLHIIDFFDDCEKYYIIMPKYTCNLKQYLSQGHVLTEPIITSFFGGIIDGLFQLQKHGIIHRDLKPENVMVDDKNLVICDMGSAKFESNNPSTTYICTRWYRSPEIILSNSAYNCCSDLWSAGCLFIEILSLSVPFKADDTPGMLTEIFKRLGIPTLQEFQCINPDLDSNIVTSLLEKQLASKKTKNRRSAITDLCKPHIVGELHLQYIHHCLMYSPNERQKVFMYHSLQQQKTR